MNKIVSFSLILLFSLKALSQDSKHEFGLYNIGLGGIVGGIGGCQETDWGCGWLMLQPCTGKFFRFW